MKSILISLIFLFMLSCASTPCKQRSCPPENIIIFVEPGVPIAVPKGFLDTDDNYFTEEEFKKLLNESEMSI